MPPPMPVTMRGDGKGARVPQRRAPATRYFAGKGQEAQSDGDDEDDDDNASLAGSNHGEQRLDSATEARRRDEGRLAARPPSVRLGNVDLERHFGAAGAREHVEDDPAARGQSDSEYETDGEAGSGDGSDSEEDEEDEAPRRVLSKPTFVPKGQRAARPSSGAAAVPVIDQTGAAEGDLLDEQQRRRLEARKLIEQQIRLEATNRAAAASEGAELGEDGVDDTDDLDPAAERAAWKLRELLRIRRDREALERREEERREVERRRAAPEAERLAEDLERVARENAARAARRREEREEAGGRAGRHHRGGFYQDDVRDRKLHGRVEETGAGAGLRGATRWTGLAAQDTSGDGLWERRDGRGRPHRPEGDDAKRRRRE